MRLKVFIVILVCFPLIPSNCVRPPSSKAELIRLIDFVKAENIAQSPLFPVEEEAAERVFPLRSVPLSDLGVGENIGELKRKLKTGGNSRNVIFSPPRSEFQFTMDIAKDSVLDFGIGLLWDENSEKISFPREKTVRFRITAESKGRKKTLFLKVLTLPQDAKIPYSHYTQHQVQFPYPLESARLEFLTEGTEGSFSYWVNPLLYQKKEKTRCVILISVDTLRADHLGCYGYSRETSPNIDSLASSGALFHKTYANSPWTLPSHVSILTSLHGVQHQVYQEDEKMDPSLITLADILRTHGFYCAGFTGGGFISSSYGFAKGFDNYNEEEGGLLRQDSAAQVCNVASEWLERHQDKDFFLFLHTYQPHDPYACPSPYKEMFLDEKAKWRHINLMGHLGGRRAIYRELSEEERQNIISLYDAEIRYTDERLIGSLVEKLKELSLYDRALIVFISDHGEEFFDHQAWGHGQSLYEESLKVPLIIKFPGSKYRGVKIDPIVSLVDVMPTILEEVGIDVSTHALDGKSLMPFLKGKEKRDRTFLADVGENILSLPLPLRIAMNSGQNKLIVNKTSKEEKVEPFLYPPPEIQPLELYDLAEDSTEKKNIVSQKPALATQLVRLIDQIYGQAKRRKTGKAAIDEELKEQLRALGYIN